MDIKSIPPDQLTAFARIMGKKGGETTKERYGTEHFRKIRKLSRGRKIEAKIGT